MSKILIPNTQIQTSRLGFGTASLHHLFSSKERRRLLELALEAGITHFDTAPMYGEGMAERELGKFLGVARQRVTIATKIGFPAASAYHRFPPLLYAQRLFRVIGRRVWPSHLEQRERNLTVISVEENFIKSLRSLNTDFVDLLLVHEPRTADIGALIKLSEWLGDVKRRGYVRYVGLAGSADGCVEIIRSIPDVFDVLQVEDSLSTREADRVVDEGWPLQITYGYLRRAAGGRQASDDGIAVLRHALARNPEGVVLVASRQGERVKSLARLLESEGNTR